MEHERETMSEEELGRLIQEGLRELDQRKTVKTPGMEYFRTLVAKTDAQKSKREKRETWVFVGLAFLILLGMTFILYSATALFMLIQILAAVLVPIGILVSRFRNRQVKPL